MKKFNSKRNDKKSNYKSESKSRGSFVNQSIISFKKDSTKANRKDSKKDGRRYKGVNKEDSIKFNKDYRINNERIDKVENNDEFILDSLSSFKEYLKYDPKSIIEIKCLSSYKDKVISLMKEYKVVDLEDKIKLQNKEFIEDSEDGNFPLQVKVKVKTFDIDDLISSCQKEERSLVIALDHITDPRNLGAIIRSAAFFGVNYVIIPEYRQTPITSTVVATSMGGLSLVKVVSVVNMGMSLEKLKEKGFWVVGTDMVGEDFKDVAGFYEKVVLVLGSEDKGISRLVKEKCDRLVSIPSFSKKKIDSLNVSVATGILIEAFKR